MDAPEFAGMTIEDVCNENAGAQAQDCIDTCASPNVTPGDDSSCVTYADCGASEFCAEEDGVKFCLGNFPLPGYAKCRKRCVTDRS